MFYLPKISITTHIIRHLTGTTNQANHGHSESIFGDSVTKIERIR